MEPLFDKTYDELREAFVCKRFAEPDVFGREDIEVWLENCARETREPWTAPAYLAWLRYGTQASRTANHLDQYASTFSYVPPGFWIGARRWMVNTLRAFHSSGRDVYYGLERDRFAVVVCGEDVNVIEVKDPDGDALNLRSATADDIQRVIFAEWVTERPKARVALDQWLAPSYKRAIANVRESAQRDFDGAVAVSPDGAKIMKATWVFVASGSNPNHGTLFPSHAFFRNKMQRPADPLHVVIERWMLDGIDLDRTKLTLDRFLASMLPGWERRTRKGGMALVSDTKCGDVLDINETVVLVDARLCPSPLPDSGRGIRVDDK